MQLQHSSPRADNRVLQDGTRIPTSIFESPTLPTCSSRWGVRRARRVRTLSSDTHPHTLSLTLTHTLSLSLSLTHSPANTNRHGGRYKAPGNGGGAG